jgi:glycosyltransferase involved in cell wall biosynthesis
MKLAVLMGNRFSAWHLAAMTRLPGNPEVVAFRADSEIQRYFVERGADRDTIPTRPIFFDYQAGPPWRRLLNLLTMRYRNRPPRLLPFHEQLRDFDVIHTWELFTDWTEEALEAKRRWGIPVCVMVWDNLAFNNEDTELLRARKARCIAEADQFIVHTERSRRMLIIEGATPEKIALIDHGVDLERFHPGGDDRAGLGLAKEEFVILFVGWLLPRKGLDFLLLALRELVHLSEFSTVKFRLVVVGSGPGRERVERMTARLGIVEYCSLIGSRPYEAMPALFRSADVFVLPSIATETWQEQFGMALMEAMACGVPTLTTYSGAIPEIVEDAALLCQPNDFLALTEHLARLVREPELRASLAEKGVALARRRYGLQDYADRLAAVYARLVGQTTV